MQVFKMWVGATVAALLSGCHVHVNSNNGSNDPICKAVGGGSATVQATPSAGGTVADAPLAFDGQLSSFASYSPAGGSGNLVIRGTAQSGTVLAAGTVAGVLLTTPAMGQSFQVTISTYLNGTLQDTGMPGTQVGTSTDSCNSGVCIRRNNDNYFGINTSKTFNAIEATLQVAGTPTTVQVRELCSR